MLEISTLGGLTIKNDSAPVTGLASRKAEALLVYLACTGQPHPREVLADLLWDDRPQARAMANLRVLLTSLRRELESFVTITRQTVAFNTENRYWLDTAVWERGLKQVEQQRSGGGTGTLSVEAVTHLAQTLELYQGDFLHGVYLRHCQGFESWQVAERERLRLKVIEALDDLVTAYLDLGEYGAGIDQAKRLLQLDPLREEAHRQLMLHFIHSGRRNAALTQYETCRQILATELGVEPAGETTALYEQIRTGILSRGTEGPRRWGEIRKSPRESTSPLPRPSAPVHNLPARTTPLIGRETELSNLAQFLTVSEIRLATILGPGGMGKTHLALEVGIGRSHTKSLQLSATAPCHFERR